MKLIASVAVAMIATQALHAQIFEANQNGTIGEYNANGTPINSSLISNLPSGGLDGVAVQATATGYDLFASDTNNGTIYEYTSTGGAPVLSSSLTLSSGNPTSLAVVGSSAGTLYVADDNTGNLLSFSTTGGVLAETGTVVTGLGSFSPRSVAANGSSVYISNTNNTGSVVEYTPGTGTTTVLSSTSNAKVSYPIGLAVSGNDLFITDNNASPETVYEFTLSGVNGSAATYDSAFKISSANDPKDPVALAVSGDDLLVSDYTGNMIKAYSISGGGNLDSSFSTISVTAPEEISVLSVPEPTPWILGIMAVVVFAALRYRALRA